MEGSRQLGGDGRAADRFVITLWIGVMVVFSALPIGSHFLAGEGENKDYDIWFSAGQHVLHGGDLYSTAANTHFEFLYPPPAALCLAPFTVFGKLPFIVVLVALNSLAWVACVWLSVLLAIGRGWRGHLWLAVAPIACTVAYVYDTYLSGQPNLILLASLLAAFVCLRRGWEVRAGALVAFAAAVKAFPIMAVGYLVYRRHWKATLSLAASLIIFLVLLPAPFRGFERNLAELSTWARGMIFDYDPGMIGQRPGNSYHWKNQSLVAAANRLLRHVPADLDYVPEGNAGPHEELYYVNWADLEFRTVNAVVVVLGLALCLAYVAVMPASSRRTAESDAIELAMLLVLMTIFSPISWFYYGVWLLYPIMVVVRFLLAARPGSRERTIALVWLGASLLLLNFVFPWAWLRPIRAIGLPFFGYLFLLGELAWMLRRAGRMPQSGGSGKTSGVGYTFIDRMASSRWRNTSSTSANVIAAQNP